MAYTQEFQGKFERFLETYQLKAQDNLDPQKVKELLTKQLKAKREQLIEQAFNHMNIVEILDALEFLESEYPTPITNDNSSQLAQECTHGFPDYLETPTDINENDSQKEIKVSTIVQAALELESERMTSQAPIKINQFLNNKKKTRK